MNAITLLFLAATAAAQTSGFDVYADGATLHRLEGRGGAILHRRSGDGGKTWSAPVRVDAGRPKAYHLTAGDMRVAAAGDLLLAVWSADGEGPHGSGPLVMARSEDAGRTWKPAASPAGNGKAGRRYPALAAAGGRFVAAWIDRSSNAKLLASTSEDGGRSWTSPSVLDEDICECCWNTAHAFGETVSVLFRDKDPRDMKVASTVDGGKTWTKTAAGPQGWRLNTCPHAGGALAGDAALHALSYTGREGAMGLHVGPVGGPQSRLGGENAKHADLAGAGGRLAAAWTEEGAVWAALSEDGKAWSEPRRLSAEKKKVSQPRVSAAGAGFRAFWLEKDGDGPARLREAALP